MKQVLLICSVVFIALSFIGAAFAPFISSHDPNLVDLANIRLSPSAEHFFGTDLLGRDVFTRLLYGSRISLLVGFGAAFISILIGATLGVLAKVSTFLQVVIFYIVELLLSLPFLLVILFLQSFLNGGIIFLICIIGISHFMQITKSLHAELVRLCELDFYKNAIVLGASRFRLYTVELLPLCMNILIVLFIFNVAHSILMEATVSFFGLGVELAKPSLGNMLNDASRAIFVGAWWMLLFPGLFIFGLIFSLANIGDYLQDRQNHA